MRLYLFLTDCCDVLSEDGIISEQLLGKCLENLFKWSNAAGHVQRSLTELGHLW